MINSNEKCGEESLPHNIGKIMHGSPAGGVTLRSVAPPRAPKLFPVHSETVKVIIFSTCYRPPVRPVMKVALKKFPLKHKFPPLRKQAIVSGLPVIKNGSPFPGAGAASRKSQFRAKFRRTPRGPGNNSPWKKKKKKSRLFGFLERALALRANWQRPAFREGLKSMIGVKAQRFCPKI